jgi:hypothetical protein
MNKYFIILKIIKCYSAWLVLIIFQIGEQIYSLGGFIAGNISSKNDKVYTLDKASTIGQRVKKGEKALRTSGDVVSLLNYNSKHMNTLKNNNIKTGIIPIDIYNAHNVNNIKNEKIFV